MDYLDTDVTNPFFWGFMSESEEQDRETEQQNKRDNLQIAPFNECDLYSDEFKPYQW